MKPIIPNRFRERYNPIVDSRKRFFASLEKPLGWAFRINTLKAEKEAVVKKFKEYGLNFQQAKFWNLAFRTEENSISRTVEYFLGYVYIQELVSMLPPLILTKELPREPIILDACASPGSKTTQLSEMLDNKGLILANDADYRRLKSLKHNVEKTGSMNVAILNKDMRFYEKDEIFDGILVDAPCSGEGTIRKNWNVLSRWSEQAIRGLSGMQKRILTNAYDMLRPGKTLVYSTCTFAPDENEEVISHLLDKRDAKIERLAISGLKTSKGITKFGKREYNKEAENCVRIWPHHNDTGGFFLAKVRKP